MRMRGNEVWAGRRARGGGTPPRGDPAGDLNMPGRSGLQVAAEIHSISPDLPIVLSTGFITDDLQSTAQGLGIRHLLYKPNTVEELGQALPKILTDRGAKRAP